ncbi:hypothetical protein BKA56DRAFT_584252 [Ilyonectria sp. MPI-CAGE-AT-0026]|nr:hypothetical protein BKA56DRAFT_584252 [Ilyonectria sp. MPI-CAGE-AT-0026]
MEKRRKTATSAGHPGQRKGPTTPQLSCELCRERKVKCDKLNPCSNCVSSRVACVPIQRLRLPRGRHVHRPHRVSPQQTPLTAHSRGQAATSIDENLNHKSHRRIEAGVDSVGSARANIMFGGSREQSLKDTDTPLDDSACAENVIPSPVTSENSEKPGCLAQRGPSWGDLAEEIHHIRRVVDSSPGEIGLDKSPALDSSRAISATGCMRVLGLCSSNSRSPIPQDVPLGPVAIFRDKAAAGELCRVYLRQVDPIIKILHRPTLSRWMLQGEEYLTHLDSYASAGALGSAVCYAAACSMTENQCSTLFHTSKAILVADCRSACEAALEKSCLLSTKDITVPQAFVLYLVGRRAEERSRDVWTLIAVAVRIAKSLCLQPARRKETGQDETFFNEQMRKRLWLAVCIMDLQACFGQASAPLTDPDDAGDWMAPAHINDCDFGPTTKNKVPDREELTDMTFALVTSHAMPSGRLTVSSLQRENNVANPNDGESGGMAASSTATEADSQLQLLQRFETQVFTLLRFCDPESSPYAWFTWHNTQCFVAALRLSALRPLKPGAGQAPPQRMEDHTELLRLTLTVLENARLMHTDPRGEGFRWCVSIPWHTLAIAFAECYVCDDTALLRRVWPLVEASYQRHRDAIAKHNDGVLQGPLAKLMRRTRERLALLLDAGCDSGQGPCERPAADLTGVLDITPAPSSELPTGAAPVLLTPPQARLPR